MEIDSKAFDDLPWPTGKLLKRHVVSRNKMDRVPSTANDRDSRDTTFFSDKGPAIAMIDQSSDWYLHVLGFDGSRCQGSSRVAFDYLLMLPANGRLDQQHIYPTTVRYFPSNISLSSQLLLHVIVPSSSLTRLHTALPTVNLLSVPLSLLSRLHLPTPDCAWELLSGPLQARCRLCPSVRSYRRAVPPSSSWRSSA